MRALDLAAEALGDERLHDFLADFAGEARADQRLGDLAGAEAGDACELLVALDDLAVGLSDLFGGRLDLDLAGEFGVQRGAMLVGVIVVVSVLQLGGLSLIVAV